MGADPDHPFVSRGGLKLRRALDAFHFDVTGLRCADLGCSTGGFTDCLLQAGAESVIAVDTAYGELAWRLRQDRRVVVRERTSALHADPPPGGVDLVVIDLGHTPQRHAIPAALRWLAPGGRIVTLIKPHYELSESDRRTLLRGGVLPDDEAARVVREVLDTLPALGARVLGVVESPIRGGSRGTGNREWLALVVPDDSKPS